MDPLNDRAQELLERLLEELQLTDSSELAQCSTEEVVRALIQLLGQARLRRSDIEILRGVANLLVRKARRVGPRRRTVTGDEDWRPLVDLLTDENGLSLEEAEDSGDDDWVP